MLSVPDLTFMGSFVANISNSIVFDELWTAYIAKLDFPDLMISVVGVSAAIIAGHLLLEMVRDSTQTIKEKTKSKRLGVRRDFPTEVEEKGLVHVLDSDATLAEELQLKEALFLSLSTSPTAYEASPSFLSWLSTAPAVDEASSSVQGRPIPKSFCEICLEDKEKWQMIEHEGCSHSFCFECTSKHIIARVEANTQEVVCPGVNCSALLNASACRHLVPEEILVRWDEAVCKSMYVDSQKLYCPYRDCSAMLVHDTGEALEKSRCPLCKRSFCAACQVPWHREFTCKEFKKLNGEKKKEDAMVMSLAKKKHWQKCPKCKMIVEKSEGCVHMTCRCKYQFCYRCGQKWSSTHGVCEFQPIRNPR